MLESFLIKIASAILKKTVVSKIGALATAYEIYSIFDTVTDAVDCVSSVNDCKELATCGIEVVSDIIAPATVDRLISIGGTSFEVQNTKSGIYIASNIIPRFPVSALNFPVFSNASSLMQETKNNFPKIKKRHFPQFGQ